MTQELAAYGYLVAAISFIMALRGLSSPVTSRQGNAFGIFGMVVAIAVTVLTPGVVSPYLIVGGLVVGGALGTVVALLTIFALACFVGYYVVWRVTPALHSPLMAVTNAVSSVIIVGALLAAGLRGLGAAQLFGAIAVALAAVNIFGGFIVTHRMLAMFKKKPQAAKK